MNAISFEKYFVSNPFNLILKKKYTEMPKKMAYIDVNIII